jgi:DNA-binding XRE family transcriptional regulator
LRNNISLVLNQKGWSQRQLADKLKEGGIKKLDYAFFNRIVSGKIKPPFLLAFALAHVLNCKVDDLFIPSEKEMFKENKHGSLES